MQCSIFVASVRSSVLFYLAVKEWVPFPHIRQPITGIVSVNAINAATIKGCIIWTCKVAELPFLKRWNLFPSFYARHNLKCLLRVSFWGSRVSFFFTAPRQPVCMSPFLPTAWQVDEAQKGTDISGAWPSSSGLYLTLYCDDPVMRTSTLPLRSPVGNLHSYLRLHLHYHMVLYIKDTSHCCNVVKNSLNGW